MYADIARQPEAIPAQADQPVTGREWRYVEVLVEWGFDPRAQDCDGSLTVTSDLGALGETWTFPATAADLPQTVLAVRPGDRIWLVLHNTPHVTGLVLTISELSRARRTCDLAEDPAAANQHPDRHGPVP